MLVETAATPDFQATWRVALGFLSLNMTLRRSTMNLSIIPWLADSKVMALFRSYRRVRNLGDVFVAAGVFGSPPWKGLVPTNYTRR
jgi:hypothetical protein